MLFSFKNKGVWGLGPHGLPLNKYSYTPPIKNPKNASGPAPVVDCSLIGAHTSGSNGKTIVL